ncbi:MAG: tRNA (N(6)-L-threonylcarbamoyladenosine(37)-C(2))-methylthiotransferase MtaB [Clostridia bacterium]|nr:tRNA (N(6)-L-threonylcarbamoyladenosine(37)-C(2))-methylthiotransferase MtaB [Clostridia bacterium]
MKTAAFYTLGCKVNQYETEAMAEMFKKRGYEIVDFSEPADVYVINTCTVTSMSDRKSRQIIRRAKKLNPEGIVIAAGCYAQVAPDAVMDIEGVNLVVGTQGKKNIVDEAERLRSSDRSCLVSDISRRHEFEEMEISDYEGMTRAYIKIQEGCNQFCTYCIIPYARGPIRSREPDEVIKEAARLAEDGFSEIILVGIHIASYGLDNKRSSLSDIILEVNKLQGIKRIRLSSIEPMTLNSEFIEKIRPADKLCPHFHLSLQSGCDETLARMNRRYTTEQYAGIVRAIRTNFPGAAITTDVMVGFPGETEEEFLKSAEFVKEMRFADIHIFQYSRRPGTPAADFPAQVSPEVKERRSKRMEEIKRESMSRFLNSFIGREAEVLFEQPVHGRPGMFEGKTANYITVRVKTDKDLSFRYERVIIEAVEEDGVMGVLL